MMDIDDDNAPEKKEMKNEPPVEETASMAIDNKEEEEESEIPEPPVLDTSPESDDDDDLSVSSSSTLSDNDNPEEEESVEEAMIKAVSLKEEGNAFFKEGNYVKSSRMYRRGVAVLKKHNNNDPQVKALVLTLQTNQSMVCYKMEKYKQSRNVASKALEVDPTHVKALYRRAVAHRQLGDYEDAKKDLKMALTMEQENVTVQREFQSLKKHLQVLQKREKMQMQKAFSSSVLYKDKQQEKEEKLKRQRQQEQQEKRDAEKRKLEWEDACVKRMANNEEAISFEEWEKQEIKRKKEEAKKEKEKKKQQEKERNEARRRARQQQQKDNNDKEDDDDDDFTPQELAMMRGYKKTTDGRTTSYFTREQSDHEKQLIGDIAPKRITDPAAAPPTNNNNNNTRSSSVCSSSAWNQAGTWEERDTTDWCMERLKSHLSLVKHHHHNNSSSDDSFFVANVTAVKDLTGHASVAVLAGQKKRYIFDFHAKLDFDIVQKSRDNDKDDHTEVVVVASSQLHLPDISSISATEHHELEILPQSWKTVDPKPECIIGTEMMEQCREGLIHAVRESVLSFVKDFNAQY